MALVARTWIFSACLGWISGAVLVTQPTGLPDLSRTASWVKGATARGPTFVTKKVPERPSILPNNVMVEAFKVGSIADNACGGLAGAGADGGAAGAGLARSGGGAGGIIPFLVNGCKALRAVTCADASMLSVSVSNSAKTIGTFTIVILIRNRPSDKRTLDAQPVLRPFC